MSLRTMLQSALDRDIERLNSAKANKEIADKYYKEYQECELRKREIQSKISELNTVIDICNRKKNEYRDIRLREIETRAEAMLELVFPEENFGVSIITERKRNNNYSVLKIGPKNIDPSKWERPEAQNGGFVEQIISTSVLAAITQMMGSNLLVLDEQFCSGDPQNCSLLKPFFDSVCKESTVVVIEHKPELYNNITRREIRLVKDRVKSNSVNIESITNVEVSE